MRPQDLLLEGDGVNVSVTVPGAAVALGLIFLDTNDPFISELLSVRRMGSELAIWNIRPDILGIRMLCAALVNLSSIEPSWEWLSSHCGQCVGEWAAASWVAFALLVQEKNLYMYVCACLPGELLITMERLEGLAAEEAGIRCQAAAYAIAGSCLAMGLRFMGSANRAAASFITNTIKEFIKVRSGKGAAGNATSRLASGTLASRAHSFGLSVHNFNTLSFCSSNNDTLSDSSSGWIDTGLVYLHAQYVPRSYHVRHWRLGIYAPLKSVASPSRCDRVRRQDVVYIHTRRSQSFQAMMPYIVRRECCQLWISFSMLTGDGALVSRRRAPELGL